MKKQNLDQCVQTKSPDSLVFSAPVAARAGGSRSWDAKRETKKMPGRPVSRAGRGQL
jgi:hypothetical protein